MDPHIWPSKSRTTSSNIHTYIQQLCEDTGCSPEDLPEAMNDRKKCESGSGISMLAARHDDDLLPNSTLLKWLVILFNGISTHEGNLIPNLFCICDLYTNGYFEWHIKLSGLFNAKPITYI